MSDETKKVEDGGDAFPMVRDMTNSPNWDYHPGMSLRDYFAGMALSTTSASALGVAGMWRCRIPKTGLKNQKGERNENSND